MRAAATLDRTGSPVADARESYWHVATGGLLPPADLRRGEQLLLDLGLVKRIADMLYPTPELEHLLDGVLENALVRLFLSAFSFAATAGFMPEAPSQEQLNEVLATYTIDADERNLIVAVALRKFDDSRRQLVGDIGEELVVAYARAELADLGRLDLSTAVRRVSLESDAFGYDISAPRASAAPRLLEVKATTVAPASAVAVFLSRNETTVGLATPDWALVVCHVVDVERRDGHVVGWMPGWELSGLLPIDVERGRWEVARLTLRVDDLRPGLPSCM